MWWLLLAQLAQAPDSFEAWLNARAEERFAAREKTIAAIQTREQMLERVKYVREKMPLKGIATKAPLNARVTGKVVRDGYAIEKVTYESLPGLVVTANLYLPANPSGKVPAVLGVAGHSNNGKAISTYQHAWLGFVKRGYAVFAYDPPGQGERIEYFDEDLGTSKVGVGVAEHNMAGVQCLLTGRPIAHYFVQDGMRAVDYLLTRPEIDPNRIGVAGNSGGGTQAAYLAAAEPRLNLAISSCYMTSWKQLWYAPGPQDAEQILPSFLEHGFDFADFAYLNATKPFLTTSAIRDYFPIAGARSAYAEIKRLSTLLDRPTRAGFFEFDDTHGWSQPRRQAASRWLDKWFGDKETDGAEAASETEEESVLYATPLGRVQSKSVADLNRAYAADLRANWKVLTARQMEDLLRMPDGAPVATKFFEGSKVELIVVVADKVDAPEVTAFRESGKSVEVVVPRGVADTKKAGLSGYDYDYQLAARAWVLGMNVPGIQTADILSVLRKRKGYRVSLYAKGALVPAAIFATALEPSVTKLALEGGIRSYTDVVKAKIHRRQALAVVPGILAHFDLPEALELSRAKVTEISPVAPNGALLPGGLRRGEEWPLRRMLPDWFTQ